jgi:hypothetical protein
VFAYTRRMSTAAWELIFMMLVLKLPILYLIGVVWWAVRSVPDPFAPAELVPAVPDSPHDPTPVCSWHVRRPIRPRPRPRVAARGARR